MHINKMIETFLNNIEDNANLEDLGQKIFELYPDLNSHDFMTILGRSLFNSSILGYQSAKGGFYYEYRF